MKFKVLSFIFYFFLVNVLWAQNLVLPTKVDLFQYSASISEYDLTEKPVVRIWGWSRDGKIAYSLESVGSFTGILTGSFIIFDTITDMIVVELEQIAEDYISSEDLYNNAYLTDISNEMKKNNIVTGQKYDFLRFPISKNNLVYDCQITDIAFGDHEYGFFNNKFVSNYNVLVTANGKRKVIGNYVSSGPGPGTVYICGYFLSPFEERALVIVAEESYTFEGESSLKYRLNGCHLGVGFN